MQERILIHIMMLFFSKLHSKTELIHFRDHVLKWKHLKIFTLILKSELLLKIYYFIHCIKYILHKYEMIYEMIYLNKYTLNSKFDKIYLLLSNPKICILKIWVSNLILPVCISLIRRLQKIFMVKCTLR